MTLSPQITAGAETASGDVVHLEQEADVITAALLHEGWQERKYAADREPSLTWRALWRWLLAQPDAASLINDTDCIMTSAWRSLSVVSDVEERAVPATLRQLVDHVQASESAMTARRMPGDRIWLPASWPGAADALWRRLKTTENAEQLPHPLALLISAWLDRHPPIVPPDRSQRRIASRLVSRERQNMDPVINISRFEPRLTATTQPVQHAFPDFLPARVLEAAPEHIIPAAWWTLIQEFAHMKGAPSDPSGPREWQRALRLMIEITSEPPLQRRQGLVRVDIPIRGPAGLIRRLWPHNARIQEYLIPLRRALKRVDHAELPATRGSYFPVRIAQEQPCPDRCLTFHVLYPDGGSNGAAFDVKALRDYGPSPFLFRTYLAVIWILDAPALQRGHAGRDGAQVKLDTLVTLVMHPATVTDQISLNNARRATRGALSTLANDGWIRCSAKGRGKKQLLTLRKPSVSSESRPALESDAGKWPSGARNEHTERRN